MRRSRAIRASQASRCFGTWTDIAKLLNEFSKVKAELCHSGEYPDPSPLFRLRGVESLYAAIKRREALEAVPSKVGEANVLPADERIRARDEALKRARRPRSSRSSRS